jgi:nitroimidazol reductase NimA-like FMN-containing flavoprotein (pyridoxamine 5'-phosphate oxidase superfamily)
MDGYVSRLETLPRRECLRLMATVPIGRIVFSRQALPAVEVVNFVIDGGEIVVRTDVGDKLAVAVGGAVVAFEADCVDFACQVGWSVTVVGHCRVVTDDQEIQHLKDTGLRSWAPGSRNYFIVISPVIVNGRRISAQRAATASLPRVGRWHRRGDIVGDIGDLGPSPASRGFARIRHARRAPQVPGRPGSDPAGSRRQDKGTWT